MFILTKCDDELTQFDILDTKDMTIEAISFDDLKSCYDNDITILGVSDSIVLDKRKIFKKVIVCLNDLGLSKIKYYDGFLELDGDYMSYQDKFLYSVVPLASTDMNINAITPYLRYLNSSLYRGVDFTVKKEIGYSFSEFEDDNCIVVTDLKTNELISMTHNEILYTYIYENLSITDVTIQDWDTIYIKGKRIQKEVVLKNLDSVVGLRGNSIINAKYNINSYNDFFSKVEKNDLILSVGIYPYNIFNKLKDTSSFQDLSSSEYLRSIRYVMDNIDSLEIKNSGSGFIINNLIFSLFDLFNLGFISSNVKNKISEINNRLKLTDIKSFNSLNSLLSEYKPYKRSFYLGLDYLKEYKNIYKYVSLDSSPCIKRFYKVSDNALIIIDKVFPEHDKLNMCNLSHSGTYVYDFIKHDSYRLTDVIKNRSSIIYWLGEVTDFLDGLSSNTCYYSNEYYSIIPLGLEGITKNYDCSYSFDVSVLVAYKSKDNDKSLVTPVFNLPLGCLDLDICDYDNDTYLIRLGMQDIIMSKKDFLAQKISYSDLGSIHTNGHKKEREYIDFIKKYISRATRLSTE